jgi:hypothetical protein
MKKIFATIILLLLLIISFLAFYKPIVSKQSAQIMAQQSDKTFMIATFKQIKEYILVYGDRQTYCNRYNNNPHIALKDMDIYLNPDDFHNINCNPKLSDFNEIVIYVKYPEQQSGYYRGRFDGSKLAVDEFTKPEELKRLFKKALLEIE